MAQIINMPRLSDTMEEGVVAKWLVNIGDEVKEGDILAEIETDKATMEVETVDEGVVQSLLYKEGDQSIPVNSPIAILSNDKNKTIKENDKKSFNKAEFTKKINQKTLNSQKLQKNLILLQTKKYKSLY